MNVVGAVVIDVVMISRNPRLDPPRAVTTHLNEIFWYLGLHVLIHTAVSFPAHAFFAPLFHSKSLENFVGRRVALQHRLM